MHTFSAILYFSDECKILVQHYVSVISAAKCNNSEIKFNAQNTNSEEGTKTQKKKEKQNNILHST